MGGALRYSADHGWWGQRQRGEQRQLSAYAAPTTTTTTTTLHMDSAWAVGPPAPTEAMARMAPRRVAR